MPDPIQVERDFQELMVFFETTPSIRHRHQLFFDFLETLDGEFRKFESYIFQLLNELPKYSGYLSWSGIDPMDVEDNLSILEKIHSKIGIQEKSDYFSGIRRNLREVSLLLFICVGNVKKAESYLQALTGISWSVPEIANELAGERNQTFSQFYQKLATELEQNLQRSVEQNKSIQRLHKEIRALFKNKDWNVLVPVAEQYGEDHGNDREYGRLRSMTADLYGESELKSNDKLIWTTNIYGAEVPSMGQTTIPVEASRKLFESSGIGQKNEKYRGAIRFEIAAAMHNGNSANLAIAALWYTVLLKASGQREQYRIHSNIAITGDIDKNGFVQMVDVSSIHLKAKAVFFSWVSIFVIPAAQKEQFEDEIKSLKKKYPNRRLEIIGVDRLAEIFYDRRISDHSAQGKISYLYNNLKREHYRYLLDTNNSFFSAGCWTIDIRSY